MNKRGLIILIIISALVVLCILEQIYIDNVLETVNNKINNLETMIVSSENVNTEDIKTEINDLDKYWANQENILCTIIDHRNMKELGEFIVKTKTLIYQNDKEEVIKNVDLIKYYVEGYDHIMKITFQNVF